MPAGTAQPDAPNSGGVRDPSQYWLVKFGLFVVLCPVVVELVV
jgi:hypothetical protein